MTRLRTRDTLTLIYVRVPWCLRSVTDIFALHTDPSVHNREVKSSVRAASAPRVQRFEIRVKLASQYPAFDLCMLIRFLVCTRN